MRDNAAKGIPLAVSGALGRPITALARVSADVPSLRLLHHHHHPLTPPPLYLGRNLGIGTTLAHALRRAAQMVAAASVQ